MARFSSIISLMLGVVRSSFSQEGSSSLVEDGLDPLLLAVSAPFPVESGERQTSPLGAGSAEICGPSADGRLADSLSTLEEGSSLLLICVLPVRIAILKQ